MTFTLNNGEIYTTTESGRFYKEIESKKTRISAEAFEEAYETYEAEQTIVEDAVELVDESGETHIIFAKVNGTRAAKRVEDPDSEFAVVNLESAVGKDNKFATTFKYMGKRYWVIAGQVKGTKAQTPKKPKKSKDIAWAGDFGDMHITLTKRQVEFLQALPKCTFWRDGIESALWCDCIAEDIGWNPMSVGAMISTLREKHLVEVTKDESRKGKPKAMAFTEAGKFVLKQMGLK